MRSERQVANSTTARRAGIYKQIAAVWDQVPETFRAVDLYEMAGIDKHNHPGHRMMIASVLTESFRARQIKRPNGSSWWRKS